MGSVLRIRTTSSDRKAGENLLLRIKSKATAEFIGTFAIVFAGCGSIMIAERFASVSVPGKNNENSILVRGQ